jgi:hypothetical protein
MVEADFDDVPIPFQGAPLRVSAWPRDQLKQMVTGAGFPVEMEDDDRTRRRYPRRRRKPNSSSSPDASETSARRISTALSPLGGG